MHHLKPDLKRFGMETLEQDICKVFKRRAYDVAASVKGVKVILDGQRLNVSSQRIILVYILKQFCNWVLYIFTDNYHIFSSINQICHFRLKVLKTTQSSF